MTNLPIRGGHLHGRTHPDGPYLLLSGFWMDEDWVGTDQYEKRDGAWLFSREVYRQNREQWEWEGTQQALQYIFREDA